MIDHHILHVHHVREELGVSAWGYGFLGLGVVLMLAGWGLIRSESAESPGRGPPQPAAL